MNNITVACIGAGYWGKNLVCNFYSLPGCKLKVCYDLNPEILSAIPTQYPGVEITNNLNSVLADPEIDAVVIASPAIHHYTMAKQALQAGKHTYVEKPLTLKTKDAEDLCHIADQQNRTLMVGHLME
jgi:UDP-2-acetamido-3-amino-2,3-dideoxy-glucuronate N-acetyltransferase